MLIEFFKKNKTVLISILITAIIFPFIVLTPSCVGFISRDIGLQIVGYGGSILGGFLTLYGVWWTIRIQQQEMLKQQLQLDLQRREDLAIQYKPFISIVSLETSIPVNNGFNRICYNPCQNLSTELKQILDKAHDNCELNFKLTNIGRGTLCSVRLREIVLDSKHFEPIVNYEQKLLCSIAREETVYLALELPPLLKLKSEFHDLKQSMIKVSICLIGTDEFDFNTFLIRLNLEIKTTIQIYSEKNNEILISPTFTPESLKTEMYTVDRKK